MSISKYQKVFGVGPTGLLISAVLIGILWLLNRALGIRIGLAFGSRKEKGVSKVDCLFNGTFDVLKLGKANNR